MNPTLLLLLLLSLMSATFAHVLWGRHWKQIPLFWLAATVGSLIVYLTGMCLPLGLVQPAHVAVGETLLGAWIMVIIASRLRV